MTTATLEPPTTDQLDLITHEFNNDGLCLEPECVTVPVPKGSVCELRLAHGALGQWFVGYHLAASKDGAIDTWPSLAEAGYHDRKGALDVALNTAVEFFEASPKSKAHRKCAGEVHAFMIALGGGSPANKSSARVPLPEPKPMDVEVARLEANPHNPRGVVDPQSDDIKELGETISAVGLLQPIGVRILSDDQGLPGLGGENRLQLLWGHRRLAAFQRLKREKIPARVYEGITDEQARLLLLIENGQQKQLDPIQEARGYAEMARDFELTQDDIAKVVKKSRPVIANALRLLELPEKVQEWIAKGIFTTAHGTALASYAKFPAVCEVIAEHVLENNLSAGEIEDHFIAEDELRSRKLIIKCPSNYVPPKDLMPTGAFRKAWSAFGYYCLDLEIWKQEAQRLVAEKKEERAAAKKREEKAAGNTDKATAAAKKKVLTPDDGSVVDASQKFLLDLVPEDQVAKGATYHGDKCTLVLDKVLWADILKEFKLILAEDQKAKTLPLIEAGWKRAAGIKKIDGFAMTCLIMSPRFDEGDFSGEVAKRLELNLTRQEKKVLLPDTRWQANGAIIKISELEKCDPVEIAQLSLGLIVAKIEAALADNLLQNWLPWLRIFAGKSEVGFLDVENPKHQTELVRLIKERRSPQVGDVVEWTREFKRVQGTVISREESEKETGFDGGPDGTPVRLMGKTEIGHIVTDALTIVVKLGPVITTKSAKKGGKKK